MELFFFEAEEPTALGDTNRGGGAVVIIMSPSTSTIIITYHPLSGIIMVFGDRNFGEFLKPTMSNEKKKQLPGNVGMIIINHYKDPY